MVQAFNVIKNGSLSHPFEIQQSNYKLIRKVFSDILFAQTYENINNEVKTPGKELSSKNRLEENSKQGDNDDEEGEGFES